MSKLLFAVIYSSQIFTIFIQHSLALRERVGVREPQMFYLRGAGASICNIYSSFDDYR